ncbi:MULTISPECIES: YhfC family intramembrane metalloprotease [unclassified Clostridium]|uniref:YhfC family intramembrane metalloprotease n=1 Tax=unclassified Clostridium TaxID=2614128 RepID=UPI00189893BE|nr:MULTISPECIES: YhfC family intramembrane metalloprotease [unclassified Clostridium]
MVSSLSIVFMVFSLLVSVIVPIGGIIFLKRKYNVSLKTFFIGAAAFFIFAQILEAPIHSYFLKLNSTTSGFLLSTPIAYMLYGGLMAGIFEETARFLCFKFIIKDRDVMSGVTYGLGHGGMEAILIGAISSINSLVYSNLINKGGFQSIMEGLSVPKEVISATYDQFVNSSSIMWAMPGIERIFAMVIHISLSIIVLYAVKERKYIYYVLAILIHAVIDFPAALYQVGVIKNIFLVEGVIFITVLILAMYVFKVFVKKFRNYNEIL